MRFWTIQTILFNKNRNIWCQIHHQKKTERKIKTVSVRKSSNKIEGIRSKCKTRTEI